MKRRSTLTLVMAAVAGAAVIAAGIIVAPRPPTLSPERTGDASLAEALATTAGNPARDSLAAAIVDTRASVVTTAGVGASENTEFEIGSLTKTMTALLLAQSVERGEVSLATPLGDLLDLGDTPASAATLGELSSHRSGLPRLATTVPSLLAGLLGGLRAADPYPFDNGDLLEHARAASVSNQGTVAYSNLGVALLGQALAAAAHTSYADLLRERILDPLLMHDTYLPVVEKAVKADAPRGFTASGRPSGPWTLGAYAPAGGVRSTVADLTLFVQALLTDDDALGVPAATVLDAQWDDVDGGGIGLAWFTTPTQESTHGDLTWHNGATGGFTSMIVLDRAAGRGAIVVGNTATPVDQVAVELLVSGSAA